MQNFLEATLPADAQQATLVGRVWIEGQGAVLVRVRPRRRVRPVARWRPPAARCWSCPTRPRPCAPMRRRASPRIAGGARQQRARRARCDALPWLLAPCDLQAVKAAGVTFVASMLERVIEEQARGDPALAEAVRKAVVAVIGDDLPRCGPARPRRRS